MTQGLEAKEPKKKKGSLHQEKRKEKKPRWEKLQTPKRRTQTSTSGTLSPAHKGEKVKGRTLFQLRKRGGSRREKGGVVVKRKEGH